MKPTLILAKLCKEGKVDGPHYQPGKVRVGNRIFTGTVDHTDDQGEYIGTGDQKIKITKNDTKILVEVKEIVITKNWHIVSSLAQVTKILETTKNVTKID